MRLESPTDATTMHAFIQETSLIFSYLLIYLSIVIQRYFVLHRVVMVRFNIEFQLGCIPILINHKYSTKKIRSTNGRFPIQHVASIISIFQIPIMNKLNIIPTYIISRLEGSKMFELDQRKLLATSIR